MFGDGSVPPPATFRFPRPRPMSPLEPGLCPRCSTVAACSNSIPPHSSKRTSVNFLPERVAVEVWVCSRERAQPHPAFHPQSFSWALLLHLRPCVDRYCWQRGPNRSYTGRNDATEGGPCPGLRRSTRSISSSYTPRSPPQAARAEGRDHFAKLQLIEDRGLCDCIKPDHQTPHLGIARLIISVPEQDALVASSCQVQPCGRVHHLQWQALLVDAHQFTKTSTNTGAPRSEQQARPPHRPGRPDAWSARNLRHWGCQLSPPRTKSTARKHFTCEDEPCLPEDHLLICSQRNANLWSVTQTMYTHVLQEDKILGDRKCPCKHVIDRLVRGPWKAITPSETRADEGVDCDHISENASRSSWDSETAWSVGRSCPASPMWSWSETGASDAPWCQRVEGTGFKTRYFVTWHSSGRRSAKRRDRWTPGSEIGDCEKRVASEHRNSPTPCACLHRRPFLQEPRSRKWHSWVL